MVNDGVLFIGLGNMGRPMASNLSQASSNLFVFDVDQQAAEAVAYDLKATRASTLQDLDPAVRIAVLMLPNSAIVESVVASDTGLLSALAPGSVIIDMSSSEPSSTVSLSRQAHDQEIGYVDAPVSGGVPKAKTGELAIMAGGSEQDFDRALPILQSMGTNVVHVGASGAGHAAKALNNLLSATNLAAAAEILSAAASAGIEPEKMISIINGSTSRSQASEFKYPRHILNGTYDSGFTMDLMLKDLGIATNIMDAGNIIAPVTQTAVVQSRAARKELDSKIPDHTEVARYYEKLNGYPFSKK